MNASVWTLHCRDAVRLFAAWLLAVLACGATLRAADRRPNFLFVYTDDQRWDAMGAVQREQGDRARFPWFKSPNMDRLVAEGVRFRNAFVTLSLCSPSRAALLTGRYNHINGITDNGTPFPAGAVTHATLLRAAGYRTAYVGKWHMGNQRGQRPGFDYSASFVGQGRYNDCPFEINGVSTPTKGWIDDVSTAFAVEWIKQNRDRPFSMVVGFKSPHGPRGGKNLPERLRNLYAGETSRPTPNCGVPPIFRAPDPATGKHWPGLADNAIHLDYMRHITGADENLGKLLGALDEVGLADDTVVVYTSDNGYYLGEHCSGDKRSIYEESLRVPMLVRYPRRFPKGRVVDEMVLNIDLAPTFLDLAGAPVPPEMQGASWKALAAGQKPATWRKSFLAEYYRELGDVPTLVGVRTDDAKIVTYPGHPEWTEVFDLAVDPYEVKNLAGDTAATAKLSAELDAQMKAMKYVAPRDAGKSDAPAAKADKKTARRQPKKAQEAALASDKPNVLILLADDLGYSDLGCYGGEIATPNLDSLARNGLRFTQFYNTTRCWPSRGALLTGYYAQQIHRDALPDFPGGTRGVRQPWARLLPDFLKPAGYRCYHSGKWHVDGKVLDGGFDRSLGMNNQGNYFTAAGNSMDDRPVTPAFDENGYYATTAIADHTIACLRDHAANYPDRPLFQYVAFIAPHFPLHALPQDIAKYRDKYLAGWEAMREARFGRQKEMGLVRTPLSALERNVGPPYAFPDAIRKLGPGEVNRPLPWSELTAQQRRFQATKMAIHAAMVDRMDQEIGRIIAQLKAMKAFENTIIFFASDNGASAEIMVRDGGHDPSAPPGSAKSYLCLGPGFSSACNTPFRRHKTWGHEGGISTPLIVHWPKGITARNELRHAPGHFIDIVPTVLELAGVQKPNEWKGEPVPAAPGRSLVPAFAKDAPIPHDSLWWLHEGNRAVRVGDWKLVAAKGEPWELYDMRTDRAEQVNLAAKMPDKVKELERVWQEQTDRCTALARKTLSEQPQPNTRPGRSKP